MGAKKDPKASSKTPAKNPKKKEGGGGGKAKKKKWSKGKSRDKLNNLVLFDKNTYDKLYKEVPTYKLITPSIVSERLKVKSYLIINWIYHDVTLPTLFEIPCNKPIIPDNIETLPNPLDKVYKLFKFQCCRVPGPRLPGQARP